MFEENNSFEGFDAFDIIFNEDTVIDVAVVELPPSLDSDWSIKSWSPQKEDRGNKYGLPHYR